MGKHGKFGAFDVQLACRLARRTNLFIQGAPLKHWTSTELCHLGRRGEMWRADTGVPMSAVKDSLYLFHTHTHTAGLRAGALHRQTKNRGPILEGATLVAACEHSGLYFESEEREQVTAMGMVRRPARSQASSPSTGLASAAPLIGQRAHADSAALLPFRVHRSLAVRPAAGTFSGSTLESFGQWASWKENTMSVLSSQRRSRLVGGAADGCRAAGCGCH